MRVNGGARPHEGAQRHVPIGCSWQGGGTTWGTSHPYHLMRGLMWVGRAIWDMLRHRRGVLNQSWPRSNENLEGGGGDGPVHRAHLQIVCSIRGV